MAIIWLKYGCYKKHLWNSCKKYMIGTTGFPMIKKMRKYSVNNIDNNSNNNKK